MTVPFQKGQYVATLAATAEELAACQRLRHLCFFGSAGLDVDGFDAWCAHVMVRDGEQGRLVCTFRYLVFPNGADIHTSYAAQYYDLAGLSSVDAPMIEIGRFCCDPAVLSADVLRIAWATLTRIVDQTHAQILFGCSSFAGVDATPYHAALGVLGARHVGPDGLRPGVKSPQTLTLSAFPQDARAGMMQMPPLLKSYLAMGGWVSDHAVIDPAMNTLHVFTGLAIANVPAARARALRSLAY